MFIRALSPGEKRNHSDHTHQEILVESEEAVGRAGEKFFAFHLAYSNSVCSKRG